MKINPALFLSATVLLILTGCETPEQTAALGALLSGNALYATNPQRAAGFATLGSSASSFANAQASAPQINVNNTAAKSYVSGASASLSKSVFIETQMKKAEADGRAFDAAKAEADFATLDKNGDGVLSAYEMTPVSGASASLSKSVFIETQMKKAEADGRAFDAAKAEADFATLDKDGDGVLSAYEMTPSGPSWYDGKLTDGATYRGPLINNYPHGSGQMTYLDGSVYTGEFFQGLPHGRGIKTALDGSKYDGEWLNGYASGTGTLVFKSGYRYEGEWLCNEPHGKGTATTTDGTVFEGDFKNGKGGRRGTATLPNRTVITGIWNDTLGSGTIRYPDGRTYEGEWDGTQLPGTQVLPYSYIEERPNGLGCMTYPDGKKQDGLWRQGVYVGRVVSE